MKRNNTMEHHPAGDKPSPGQCEKQQVEGDDHDEIYSDEEWPTNDPGKKSYKITKSVYIKPQDEYKWEEELKSQPVLVGGEIYEPGEWNDPEWHSLKATLPPWICYPGAVDVEESRNWVQPPGGAGVVDLRTVQLAEVKRMKENKGYVLHFLEETEDIKTNIHTYMQAEESEGEEVNEGDEGANKTGTVEEKAESDNEMFVDAKDDESVDSLTKKIKKTSKTRNTAGDSQKGAAKDAGPHPITKEGGQEVAAAPGHGDG